MEMLMDVLNTADPAKVSGALAMMSGIIIGFVSIGLIKYLMIALGYSKMFRKANIAGWKAFIPFYNDYIRYKMVWKGMFYFLFLALNFVAVYAGNGDGLVFTLLSCAAAIAMLVIVVKQHILMANAFGKGVGCALLLIFFPGITSLVLGFGKAQYIAKIPYTNN